MSSIINNFSLTHPSILQQEQYLISSCTDRLRALQLELSQKHLQQQLVSSIQQKNLRQQLISSMIMKQNSFKKLSQEQNILIAYLKDQLRQLQLKNHEIINLHNLNVQISDKCQVLSQVKQKDHQAQQLQLIKLKQQYNELYLILNQTSQEHVRKYELRLRLTERNTLTKSLLSQKFSQFIQLKDQHQQSYAINKKRKTDNQLLSQQISLTKSKNIQATKKFTNQSSQLQAGKQKFLQLQKQVQRLQQQRQRLRKIQKAAQKDNILLKQQLKNKTQSMKKKQEELQHLTVKKQQFTKQKQSLTNILNKQITSYEHNKQLCTKQVAQGQISRSTQEKLKQQIYLVQDQIQPLTYQCDKQQQTKRIQLNMYLENEQALNKYIYFIQQYMSINSELIHQIQILLQQEIRKENIDYTYGSIHRNRSLIINSLKQFLQKIQSELDRIFHSFEDIKHSFTSYRLSL